MRAFCADVTATQAALLLDLNRKTINRYYAAFRQAIFAYQEMQKADFAGTVEVDESYFGLRRPRAGRKKLKTGRGTAKQPVFGIFERGGRVYTEIVPNASKATLQRIIRGEISLDTEIVSDGWRGYDGLVDVGYDRHMRINKQGKTRECFVQDGVHINSIESFWSFTKRRLGKFNGVRKNFDLHLKECEWRWNRDFNTLNRELKKMMV